MLSSSRFPIVIFITPGDPFGIGPEVTVKALKKIFASSSRLSTHFVIVGAQAPFKKLNFSFSPYLEFKRALSQASFGRPFMLAAPQGSSGFQAGWSIECAVKEMAKLKKLSIHTALVTGPINKDHLVRGGFNYLGHTEFLRRLCKTHFKKQPRSSTQDSIMMLANQHLRVSLVTTHLPLNAVSSALSVKKIAHTIKTTYHSLKNDFNILDPRIAVLALNPHAGEEGRLGGEEKEAILPAIRAASRFCRTKNITGPHAADSFFALLDKYRPDAVIAMYHDQGLIPVKLLDFKKTVNITLGLPIVRTSVDHGTAYDLVGKNSADESSMLEAIYLAQKIVMTRSHRHGMVGSK